MINLNNILNIKNKNIINIVFEGLDKSGKSTISRELYNYLLKNLNKNKYKISLYNHPNSKICKEEREFLLNNIIDPLEEAKIFLNCKNKLIKYMNENLDPNKININIIDRWTHSTFVYQNINLFKTKNILLNDEITELIESDINQNGNLHIDFVVYLDTKYIIYKNRKSNTNVDNRENLINDKNYFSLAKKLYNKIIKDNYLNLHKNYIVINSDINNIGYKVLIIINKISNIVEKGGLNND